VWIRCVGLSASEWLRVGAAIALPLAIGSLTLNPVPVRRVAPLLALVFGLIGGLPVPSPALTASIGLGALASGIVGLSSDFVDVIETPFGIFSGPRLFWLHLLVERPTVTAWIAFLALCGIAIFSATRVLAIYGRRVTAVSISSDEYPSAS